MVGGRPSRQFACLFLQPCSGPLIGCTAYASHPCYTFVSSYQLTCSITTAGDHLSCSRHQPRGFCCSTRTSERTQSSLSICSYSYATGGQTAVHPLVHKGSGCLLYRPQTLPYLVFWLLQAGIAIAFSVLSCTAYYLVKAPNHLSLRFALSAALLFAASLTVCRTFLLERKQQVKP